MKLVPDCGRVLRHAWSIRLMVLAGLFAVAEAILPFFSNDIPHWAYGLLMFGAVIASIVSRVVAQRNLTGDQE